jgi:hypothetical protein
MPELLRGIVRSVVDAEADLELVGELPDHASLADVIARDHPDVVVGNSSEADIERLLRGNATMKVLQIEGIGGSSFLYELQPARTALGELSPARLLEAIRT